ncbi:beta-N-acetylglucosaminidase domain-containing protein [Streptomyces sp. XD-27]|uniref:beta-N-acetylglucosaminidase domain-containing protein n=1 Tax=Streptomyces sp. XD-27 TaxID=3062779 RepID=UPI0026F4587A|nr:beta-N-acetylglucosaminidase domain-containing protein [Streptomyces sp. XD-27]WKX70345.1 beta-N-acetylglucosaminidase domain-containing protein [Streptomyces sp. XD-27]
MQFPGIRSNKPRTTGATALAAAVIGGLLGGAPGAVAAPAQPEPETGGATAADRVDATGLPPVWPRPQSLQAQGGQVPVGETVTLVADGDADPYALDALRALLRDAGADSVTEVTDEPANGGGRAGSPPPDSVREVPSGAAPAGGLVVRVQGRQAEDALRTLRAPARGDLPGGGYRLAVGTVDGAPTVALAGVGEDGLFHAVQTLRQLLVRQGGSYGFPAVTVRDWPSAAVRGTTEGFYGDPWSRQQRLDHLDFMGRTKQNRYLYAAGDDPYRQARWRDPYPAERRDEFRALADRARRNHVTMAWAVAPGQNFCFSSDKDVKALTRKIDAMWALGMRGFQLQFQDVSYTEWHCMNDRSAFGSGSEAAAKAQARVANAVAAHLADRYADAAAPLSLLPTEYYQDGATDFRRALAEQLDDGVEVAWTGVGVVPRTITGGELAGARAAFGHPLLTMDNYPVNDYAQDRIFLGPYTGRDPAVATGSTALLANAMEQPKVSRIPLFTAADFAWNPRGYRPHASWLAAVDDLAGPDADTRAALRALAGNDASSVLSDKESAYLTPRIDAFWTALDGAGADGAGSATGSGSGGGTGAQGGGAVSPERAATRLKDSFRTMRDAPGRLKAALGDEAGPWLEQLGRYGDAGLHAVDMLLAQKRGDGAEAWRHRLELHRLRKEIAASAATVGKGVLTPFLASALGRSDAWAGVDETAEKPPRTDPGRRAAADGDPVTALSSAEPVVLRFDRTRPLSAVTALTGRGSDELGTLEAHVPGRGWQRLSAVSGSGWTQAPGRGIRADAIRLVWSGGGEPPAVHEITPWFTDSPAAELRLSKSVVDAEIGGGATTVAVRLTARRPGDVHGDLTVRAPAGVKVSAPAEVTAPRGEVATARIQLSVPAGGGARTYRVPVRFGSEEAVLTVRAHPPTGGPDLARGHGVRAASSGDESADFPASAAVDGDPATRWSSTTEDGAWYQLELARPARLGRLDLHWQDAHPSHYRVQVSADGRTWRTAATVADGRGGKETVRVDAPQTRFIRIQSVRRATRFGISLWSVEAYAVTAEQAPPSA